MQIGHILWPVSPKTKMRPNFEAYEVISADAAGPVTWRRTARKTVAYALVRGTFGGCSGVNLF